MAALEEALRFEAAPLSRMGVSVSRKEQRRLRRLRRLRWVPFLKADLRAQRRLLRLLPMDD